jgi:DNA transformation protein and related proteins
MDNANTISELKSLGPKSQEMLARAAISSFAQLRELGSVEVYFRAKQAHPGVSLNLLWALESALSGEPWQAVARIHRTSLLLALEERENNA